MLELIELCAEEVLVEKSRRGQSLLRLPLLQHSEDQVCHHHPSRYPAKLC